MFSLIISIISIALVAALAAATVYFGGAAFNKGAAGADASTFINAGQQIAGAFTLADTDGSDSLTIAALTAADTNGNIYLSQVPTYKGSALVLDAATGYLAVEVSENVCLEIAKRVDQAATAVVAAATPVGLFGCNTATAAGNLTALSVAGDAIAYYKVK